MAKEKRATAPRRPRVQLDLSPQVLRRIETMKELAGISSTTDLVREALKLYDLLLTETKNNEELRIQLVKGDTVREAKIYVRWPPVEE